jgi:shikimate kinase
MYKNILIIGAARTGKTTLSRRINKEFGYSVINLDNIVSGLKEAFPELGIKHDYDDLVTSKRIAPFLIQYLKELVDGPNFYNDTKFVIEGVQFDFDMVMPSIDKEKYLIIGLTYNNIDKETLYNNIKKYDTEDDWTYYISDEDLKKDVNLFIDRNKYYNNEFIKYNIKTYDVSNSRTNTIDKIIEDLKSLNV